MLGKCSYNVMIYNWVGMIDHGTLLDCLSSWFKTGKKLDLVDPVACLAQ